MLLNKVMCRVRLKGLRRVSWGNNMWTSVFCRGNNMLCDADVSRSRQSTLLPYTSINVPEQSNHKHWNKK